MSAVRAQGVCPVCKQAVGLRPGDLAAQHTARQGFHAFHCAGAGQRADVLAWATSRREILSARIASVPAQRAKADEEHAATLARITKYEDADRAELAAVERIAAKRGAR